MFFFGGQHRIVQMPFEFGQMFVLLKMLSYCLGNSLSLILVHIGDLLEVGRPELAVDISTQIMIWRLGYIRVGGVDHYL